MCYCISPVLFSFLQAVSIHCRVIPGCRDGVRLGRWPRKKWGLLRRFSLCTERPPEHAFWNPWRSWSTGKRQSPSGCPGPLEKEEEGPGDRCGSSLPEHRLGYLWPCVDIQQVLLPLTSSLEDARGPWQPRTHQGHMGAHCREAQNLAKGSTWVIQYSHYRLEGLLTGREGFFVICAPDERTRTNASENLII